MNPTWLDYARSEVGVAASGEDGSNPRVEEYHRTVNSRGWDDKIPWCSSFVNWCVQQAGLRGTNSALARSWLEWGVALENPCVGCVVVLWREDPDSPKGHVGLFLRADEQHVFLLGGNQLGAVREHFYPKNAVLGYRWPELGTMPDELPTPMSGLARGRDST
jgi:uncharacterized protein (TIGR02594 family)